jgi:glycosyltransferase involved in cell wall biosynthesis
MNNNHLKNTNISISNTALVENYFEISIIIATHNSFEFLEDCLNSIYESANGINIQVLIGIDHSISDLNWLEKNSYKYKNLQVFWFEQNIGPYVIKNTLIDQCLSENILFFDSDDIMNKNMIPNFLFHIKNNLIVRFKYSEFKLKKDISKGSISRVFSDSNFGIRKQTFNKLNGFENWKSSADIEFHYRTVNNKITSKNIEKIFFNKRIHKDGLSLKLDTNGTLLKQNYIKIINQKLRNKKWILNNKKTYNFIRVVDYQFIHYKNELANNIKKIEEKEELVVSATTVVNKDIDQNNFSCDDKIKEKNISIIIPAFKASNFIKECLDSIYNQLNNEKYGVEVLVGIDNCQETLNWFKVYAKNYTNLRVFWFGNNIGPYIIKNTLINFATNDNILFFDADDVMNSNLISDFFNNIKENTILKFKYCDFFNSKGISQASTIKKIGEGVFGIKKQTLIKLNGFEDWRCAADTEFQLRARRNRIFSIDLNKSFFYRRLHDNNLTVHKDTNERSALRKDYVSKINRKIQKNNWHLKNRVIFETQELSFKDNLNQSKLSIIIPAYKANIFLEDCINSILSQKLNNLKIEILIGIDACQETLKFFENNKQKFKNINFYWFNSNVGPYIIRNTLVEKCLYKNILFFDADDVMGPELLYEVVSNLDQFDTVRYHFINFENKINKYYNLSSSCAGGTFGIKKEIFLNLNGFEPWKCAADAEFIERSKFKNIKELVIKKPLFYRRIHDNNLTKTKDSGMQSELRSTYKNIISKKIQNNFDSDLTKLSTIDCQKISLNDHSKFLHLVISRVAIKWNNRNHEVGLNWENWVNNSFYLYDNYCRVSLENQTNKNFRLISLVDSEIKDYGKLNKNEEILFVNDISQITSVVKNYISSLPEKYDFILMTRIDRDDVIKNNFIENLHNNVNDYLNNNSNITKFYFDIENVHMHSIINNISYYKDFYKKITSPFISVIEKNDSNLECVIYNYDHSSIKSKIDGKKYKNLEAIQIVHDHNLLNHKSIEKLNLNQAAINLNEFGIK